MDVGLKSIGGGPHPGAHERLPLQNQAILLIMLSPAILLRLVSLFLLLLAAALLALTAARVPPAFWQVLAAAGILAHLLLGQSCTPFQRHQGRGRDGLSAYPSAARVQHRSSRAPPPATATWPRTVSVLCWVPSFATHSGGRVAAWSNTQ